MFGLFSLRRCSCKIFAASSPALQEALVFNKNAGSEPKYDVALALHAFKSGHAINSIRKAAELAGNDVIPYIIVLGGTDINEMVSDVRYRGAIAEAIWNAKVSSTYRPSFEPFKIFRFKNSV